MGFALLLLRVLSFCRYHYLSRSEVNTDFVACSLVAIKGLATQFSFPKYLAKKVLCCCSAARAMWEDNMLLFKSQGDSDENTWGKHFSHLSALEVICSYILLHKGWLMDSLLV